MEIKLQPDGTTLEISLSGRLDTTTSPELEKVIKTSLDGVENLIFNMADLDYISSAGLRVILTAQKAMNGKHGGMKLVSVQPLVIEVFKITGFANIIDIE